MPHVLSYGPSGSGKSTLAASAPKPQLVCMFDAMDDESGGNARPYLTQDVSGVRRTRDVVMVKGHPSIIQTRECFDASGTLIRKLWHFDPASSEGVEQFKVKWAILEKECSDIGARTLIFDSLTLYIMAGRMYAGKGSNEKEEEQIAYMLTDHIRDLCIKLCSLPLNVILCAHVSGITYSRRGKFNTDDVKPGQPFVDAPGVMARRITSLFSDVWYSFVDAEGVYCVQTSQTETHIAKNTVEASEICRNVYDEIVKNQKPILWMD